MTDETPLFGDRFAAGALARLPRIDAHRSYVLAYRNGGLRAFTQPPKVGERAGSVGYWIVDTSPRLLRGTMKMPAHGDRYAFDANYDAHWRVADPAEVVRRNVVSGEVTVTTFLQQWLRPIGRHFAPEDAWGVEARAFEWLGAEAQRNGLPVGNGLALVTLTVQVTPDPRVVDRGVALDDDAHQGELTVRRTQRLQGLLEGDGAAIRLHLAQNPDDTSAVLQMIMDAKDKNERLRLEWLDRMRADDAIQEADYEQARAAVLGGGAPQRPVLNTGSFGAWPDSGPRVIDAGPPIPPPAPWPGQAPAPAPRPEPEFEPTRPPARDPGPPPASDLNPFATTRPPSWLADAESRTEPPMRSPVAPTPPSGGPAVPREVCAERRANGSVLVWWKGGGDVEYRVRRLAEGDEWRVVARTTDTCIEDGGAPEGPTPVYAVSATAGGIRSAEVLSD